MLRMLATTTILICGVGLADPARSQEVLPGGRPVPLGPAEIGEGLVPVGGIGLLVQFPAVQDELAMTEAQRSRIDEVRKDNTRAEQAAFQRFQVRFRSLGPRPTPGATEALSRQFQEDLDALGSRFEAAVLKVLDRRQRTRLDQIHLQADGPIAFLRREVRERLGLDPEQVKTIRALIARGRQQIADGAAVPAGVPPVTGPITPEQGRALYESKPYQDAIRKNREIARSARSRTLQAITKLLSKGQHAEYQAMLGEPFDFTRLQAGDKPTPQP